LSALVDWLACFVLAMSLLCMVGCNQKEVGPTKQQQTPIPSASGETTLWRIDLKISPDHPRMVKPLTFTLHITDDHMQPVSDAEVNGAVTMKAMDMGTTRLKFAPQGNGDYEASMKSVDMSGPWNLAVDASLGAVHAKKNFEVTVYD
jgi:hypothetical protein